MRNAAAIAILSFVVGCGGVSTPGPGSDDLGALASDAAPAEPGGDGPAAPTMDLASADQARAGGDGGLGADLAQFDLAHRDLVVPPDLAQPDLVTPSDLAQPDLVTSSDLAHPDLLPPNTPPTTSGIADVTVNEDAADTRIDLWPAFADAEDADASLTYSITTNTNPALFATTALAQNEFLVLHYATDANGSAMITVEARDSGGLRVTTSFKVTVLSVNDPPRFTLGPDQTIIPSRSLQTVQGFITGISTGPADEAAQTVLTFGFTVTVTSNPANIFSVAPALTFLDPTDPNYVKLTYTPNGNVGTAIVSVTLRDNGGTLRGGVDTSAPLTFQIRVVAPGQVQFGAARYSVNEADGTVALTVTRTGGSGGGALVHYQVSDGSALAASDYSGPAQGRLTWEHGDASPRTITIPITNDTAAEAAESFTVTLLNPTGVALGAQTSTTVGIVDDDPAMPPAAGILQFTISRSTTTEPQSAVIRVVRHHGGAGAVTVRCTTGDDRATAGQDYTAVATTLAWNDGEVGVKQFTVPLLDDALVEGNETLWLRLSNPGGGASLGTISTATLTILDDEPPATNNGMLVYASRREDGYLHVMAYSLRTGRASQLTFGLYDDSIPEASSDGTTVVFASSRLHAGGGVHVVDTGIYGVHTWIDANGDIGASDPYYIAGALGTQSYDPAINGDKTAVIWGSGSLLRTVATDAVTGAPVGAETTITQNIGFVAWGADGHTVIADSPIGVGMGANASEIVLLALDNTNTKVIATYQLTNDPNVRDYYSDISYQGDRIAWQKDSAQNGGIWIADLAYNPLLPMIPPVVTNAHKLTDGAVPYWNEAGDTISFFKSSPNAPSAGYEIYVIDLATKVETQITHDAYPDIYPTFVNTPLIFSTDDVMIVGSIPGAVGAWLPVDLLVSQSRQARETFAIDYSASDGSGVAGVDYLAAPGTLHFNPGDTNHTVAIQIKQDPNAAGTRTFSVRLAKADAEGAFGRNQATVTAVY